MTNRAPADSANFVGFDAFTNMDFGFSGLNTNTLPAPSQRIAAGTRLMKTHQTSNTSWFTRLVNSTFPETKNINRSKKPNLFSVADAEDLSKTFLMRVDP